MKSDTDRVNASLCDRKRERVAMQFLPNTQHLSAWRDFLSVSEMQNTSFETKRFSCPVVQWFDETEESIQLPNGYA